MTKKPIKRSNFSLLQEIKSLEERDVKRLDLIKELSKDIIKLNEEIKELKQKEGSDKNIK